MASLKIFTKSVVGKFIRRIEKDILICSYTNLCCGKLQSKCNASIGRGFSDSHPNIVKSTFPDIEIPIVPLHEYIFENLAQHGHKTAVTCAETKKNWTYNNLFKNSKNLAASYQKKFNLKKGDRQIVVLPNCPEYTTIFLSGSMAGIVTSTVNPIYTPSEISYQLTVILPKILFTTAEAYSTCTKALNLSKLDIPIVVVKIQPQTEIPAGAVSFAELVENTTPVDFNPVNINVNDDLVIPFSSGTSGLPKGVQLSHKCIVSNLVQYDSGNALKYNSDKGTNESIILGVLPMFHIYGMVIVTLDALRCGAHLVSLPRFEPKLFVDAIYTYKTEILYLVPPLVFFLGNQPMVEPKHLKFVKYIVVGAAPCGARDWERLLNKCSTLEPRQGYGMTETSPLITMTHDDRAHKRAAAGHPLMSTLLKISDLESGEPLPRGSHGEICVKGPQVMKGYLNQREATEKTFDSDGWLRTGDIGYCDDEGDLFVVDRLKEMIKVKGFQVAPAELEEILRTHPKVADAAVVGVAHPELGEAPKAFIVLKKDAVAKEKEVVDFMKERLTSYKQLKGGVEFLEAIPRSTAGKILRRELRNLSS